MSGEPVSLTAAPGGRPARKWWWLLALLAAAYFASFAYNPNLFFVLGVAHYDGWFIDTFALLASSDAVTRGLNPYAPNPLDYFHRPHVYSHWWLYLHNLGLTRADSLRLGLGLVISFLVAAWWRLRPRTLRELLWYLAVLCSPPILLALDRGNNDLFIFLLLAPLVPCLLNHRRWVRLIAPILVFVAAMLKYYPAAAGLVLLAHADRAELRPRLVIAFLLMAFAGCSLAGDLKGFGPLAPQPEGLMSFGATGFMNELGWMGWGPKVVGAGLALAAVAWFWRRGVLGNWEPSAVQRSDWLHLILGAVLLTGCFFTSMNFAYRWVFALWLAPALWRLPRDPDTPVTVRRIARATMWLLLFMLWWTPFCCLVVNRFIGVVPAPTIALMAKVAFLLEQPADWAFFLCLLAFLTHFTRRRLAVLLGSA